jgi:hypothetical protein
LWVGGPVPLERLIKSSLLIALYTIRSERQFCEQLDYNLLFRWFLDMSMVEPSFDPTVFTKNRARLIEHDVGKQLLGCIVQQARKTGLMSNEHFTVDGTLIEAWASLKSFRRRMRSPAIDRPAMIRATLRSTSMARSAATTLMSRRPTPNRSWLASRTTQPRSSPIHNMR